MSTPRPHDRRIGDRLTAHAALLKAERRIETAVLAAMDAWFTAARQALIYDIARNHPAIVAAGFSRYTGSMDAVLHTYNVWRAALDNDVLPTVGVAFGEAFNQVRKANEYSAYRWQQEHLAEVHDRLVIWPEGAFEELRPELLEALAEGESIEEITDRVGMVLGIDAPTRELRGRISEVDRALADPDTPAEDMPELKSLRRQLWQRHDESLGEWRWKARRIARTEAQGAREGGALAAAQAMEIATGQKFYKRWLSTDDERVRLTHRVADGQMVPLAVPFTVGGFPMMHPADPYGVAHETINCRCTLLIHSEAEAQKQLAGPDGGKGIAPGAIRLGPDDPDDARTAIEELAADKERPVPTDDRDTTFVPPAPDAPDPTDAQKEAHANPAADKPDLSGVSMDELEQFMADASADGDQALFEWVIAEYERRLDSNEDHEALSGIVYELSDLDVRHVLDGEPDNLNAGGHRSGTGRRRKTEFPADWDDEAIVAAIESVMAAPESSDLSGDRTTLLGEIDGVIIRVSAFERDGQMVFRTAYPVNGDGVIKNGLHGPEPIPLDRSIIDG